MSVVFNRRFALVAAGVCAAVFGNAQSWDLANDFSLASNPNGAWSYGTATTLGGFTAYTNNVLVGNHYLSVFGYPGLDGWSTDADAFPMVAKNFSGDTHFETWSPGQVIVHPLTGGFMSLVRWTDPLAGAQSFNVAASFRRVEDVTSFTSQYWLLLNGSVLSSGSLLNLNQTATYGSVLTLHAGDSLDFVVGCPDNSNGTDLNVEANIAAVPEPCSMVALLTAGVGLALRRRNK